MDSASTRERALPSDVRLACDSAAALARRAGARLVRIVADTFESPGGRACVVSVDSLRGANGATPALFKRGLPGGVWHLNLFETSDPAVEYAVWQPTIFCDITVRYAGKETGSHRRRDVVQGFDLMCVPQTPQDTPAAVGPHAP